MNILHRLRILRNWLFKKRYGVGFFDILRYFFRLPLGMLTKRYFVSTERSEDFIKVRFAGLPDVLYWPAAFPFGELKLIAAETFNKSDWHHYEQETTVVGQDDVVVDVGAAEGLFSLSVIRRCRRVMMVEPNEIFYRSLNVTFGSYLKEGRAKIVRAAAGAAMGTAHLLEKGGGSRIDGNGTQQVELATLDSLLENEEKVDYIKADVEGYELEVLKGAERSIMRHKPRMAITSYHAKNIHTEIIDYVRSIVPGYKVHMSGITLDDRPFMLHFYL